MVRRSQAFPIDLYQPVNKTVAQFALRKLGQVVEPAIVGLGKRRSKPKGRLCRSMGSMTKSAILTITASAPS
jgi:hypothetical protein